jgi:hypothetical protein
MDECHPSGTVFRQTCGMEEYLIGAGAVLTAGGSASIAPAALHAHTDPALAGGVKAFLVDFEGPPSGELSRVVIAVSGWNAARFSQGVAEPLLAQRECTLADVLRQLARSAGTDEVHCFARWLPDAQSLRALGAAGIALVMHPLETIDQAALVCGQRLTRWSAFRAA